MPQAPIDAPLALRFRINSRSFVVSAVRTRTRQPACRRSEIGEADIAVWEKGEAPPFRDGDLGDFAPLAADRNVRAKQDQGATGGDAFAMGANLFPNRCDLGVELGLLRRQKFFHKRAGVRCGESAVLRNGGPGSRRGFWHDVAWQVDGKDAAAGGQIAHGESAGIRFDAAAGDGEPQPEAGLIPTALREG